MNIMFVETRVFTRRVERLGLEGALKDLQEEILANPEAGRLDPGTGGLRKIRLPDKDRGKGKRGGARAHYLWLPDTAEQSIGRSTPRNRSPNIAENFFAVG